MVKYTYVKGDDEMDIAALSAMASMSKVQNQASIMIMRKVMDTSQQNGQAITDLLSSSGPNLSPAHLGQTIDISA